MVRLSALVLLFSLLSACADESLYYWNGYEDQLYGYYQDRPLSELIEELEKIKTVEQLQKTTASINKNFASTKSSGNRVADSLARAKKKQQEWKDNQKAGDWMEEEESSSDLDKKLSEEGIGGKKTSANDIIERLKNKNKS